MTLSAVHKSKYIYCAPLTVRFKVTIDIKSTYTGYTWRVTHLPFQCVSVIIRCSPACIVTPVLSSFTGQTDEKTHTADADHKPNFLLTSQYKSRHVPALHSALWSASALRTLKRRSIKNRREKRAWEDTSHLTFSWYSPICEVTVLCMFRQSYNTKLQWQTCVKLKG